MTKINAKNLEMDKPYSIKIEPLDKFKKSLLCDILLMKST